MLNKFLLMVAGHMLADHPLQGEFLALGKNRFNPDPRIPWYHALGAHAIIHGGMVGLITKSPILGIAETIIHAVTDDMKCSGRLSYNQDQAIHLVCKALWATLSSKEE